MNAYNFLCRFVNSAQNSAHIESQNSDIPSVFSGSECSETEILGPQNCGLLHQESWRQRTIFVVVYAVH